MDPVLITAFLGVAASAARLGYDWLTARSHRRRVQSEVRSKQERLTALVTTIKALPPGSKIIELFPDGRRITIKLPPKRSGLR
ncbi:hypothetical protein [Streptomyces swartbergensis]|uniref:hypothetical protein n=1 Tax=Streptomyces swartbergensis TaxID=487165 RepID=UPI00381175D0